MPDLEDRWAADTAQTVASSQPVTPRERRGHAGSLLLFCPGFSEPGGVARRSRLLAAGFADRGWRVRVISRGGLTRRLRLRQGNGVLSVEVPGFGWRIPGALLYYAVALPLGLAWSVRADATIGIQLSASGFVASMTSSLTRTPAIALTTGTAELGDVRHVSTGWLAPIRRAFVHQFRYVVAQTSFGLDELAGLVRPDQGRVVPNPVLIPDPVPSLTGRPRVLFAGRFSEEKNLVRLLTAWKRTVSKAPSARLTLAGDESSFRDSSEVVIQSVRTDPVLARTVSLPGWVADMAKTMSEHDVFVLPSLSEGMSNALVEAAALGRVVVASDIAPNRAVVGNDYPLLCNPGDPQDIAQKLTAALSDDQLRERARRLLGERIGTFELTAVVAQLERLLDP